MSLHDSDRQNEALVLEEELEMSALDTGIARYRAERQRNDPSNGAAEQSLIGMCLDSLTTAIEQLQDHVAQGKPAKGVTHWGYPLLSLPADKLAFLTLAEAINHADTGEQSSTTTIALAIGSRAKVEREFDLIRKQARDVYTYLLKRNKNWSRRAHRTAKSKAGGIDVDWTPTTRAWLGMVLLEHAVSFTDVLVLERQHLQGKSRIIVRLRPEVRTAIEKSHGECELLRPSYLPMVVPPNNWSDPTNGGYIWHRNPLVKRNRLSKTSVCQPTEMPLVLEAVNILQRTEWQINQPVLAVLKSVWDAGGGWATLPSAVPLPIPHAPFNWDTATKEQKSEWKLQASRVHDENARLVSQRKSVLQKLWIAQKLQSRKAIYFPYQLDWRGRAYPLSANLHPQTDDVGRSLIRFHRAEKLGTSGLRWLRIHLANCYGIDKIPFAAREQWTLDNLDNIRQSAANPIDFRWWAEGENPWQTLAACYEVATATPESLSQLPIQMDGSCNGLQHFSAMGRDVVGGRAVNLIPSDKPSDVYQQVADRVCILIDEDICSAQLAATTSNRTLDGTSTSMTSKCTLTGSKADSTQPVRMPSPRSDITTLPIPSASPMGREDRCTIESSGGDQAYSLPSSLLPFTVTDQPSSSSLPSPTMLASALSWKGFVDRKVVKRATMTIVYGLTRQGMKQQFLDDGHCDSLEGNLNQNAAYMTGATMRALSGVLTGASAIMDWLRTVAKIASEKNVAVRWTSPAGFPVVQEYVEQRVRHLYTAMQKLTLREPDEKGEISLARQVRGLPPNFVHSFDAAHMMLSVVAAHKAGLTSFSMIHDSYGTHAAHIDTLNTELRAQFVQMYQPAILADLHKEWSALIGVELPPPPPQGDLDLSQVLLSPYFFA